MECLVTMSYNLNNRVTSSVPPKMSHLILITCNSYSLDLKGFSDMTQLNLKRVKPGFNTGLHHRNRSVAAAEPAETKRPQFQSRRCKCWMRVVLGNQ